MKHKPSISFYAVNWFSSKECRNVFFDLLFLIFYSFGGCAICELIIVIPIAMFLLQPKSEPVIMNHFQRICANLWRKETERIRYGEVKERETGPSLILLSFKCRSIAYHSYQNEFLRAYVERWTTATRTLVNAISTIEFHASSNLWGGGCFSLSLSLFFFLSFSIRLTCPSKPSHQL